MPAAKGTRPPSAGKGREAGSKNRVTGALKDMILAALDKAGGVDYLYGQAGENPAAFMTLVGKVLPLQVTGDKDNPVHTHTTIEEHIVDPAPRNRDR